jgi:hypothetical protein
MNAFPKTPPKNIVKEESCIRIKKNLHNNDNDDGGKDDNDGIGNSNGNDRNDNSDISDACYETKTGLKRNREMKLSHFARIAFCT